jgi:hypothetical protein
MKIPFVAWVCAGLLLAGSASQAGTVTVVFSHPQNYTDVRDPDRDANANMQTIADYLRWLGKKYLPADQALQIEVLDVDLAGKLRMTSRWGEIRLLGKPLDWPKITLRYKLESRGQVLASAEESVADMAYATRVGGYIGSEPLSYEKRMLRDWFRARFVKK